jgi:hypothetical protein
VFAENYAHKKGAKCGDVQLRDLDGVVHFDNRVRVTDGATIVGNNGRDSLCTDSLFLHTAQFEGGFFLVNAVQHEASLGVKEQTVGIVRLRDGNNIHESSREVGVGAYTAINGDKLLHADSLDLLHVQSVLQAVTEDDAQRKALAHLVRTSGWTRCPDTIEFSQHPVGWRMETLQMFLRSASHICLADGCNQYKRCKDIIHIQAEDAGVSQKKSKLLFLYIRRGTNAQYFSSNSHTNGISHETQKNNKLKPPNESHFLPLSLNTHETHSRTKHKCARRHQKHKYPRRILVKEKEVRKDRMDKGVILRLSGLRCEKVSGVGGSCKGGITTPFVHDLRCYSEGYSVIHTIRDKRQTRRQDKDKIRQDKTRQQDKKSRQDRETRHDTRQGKTKTRQGMT